MAVFFWDALKGVAVVMLAKRAGAEPNVVGAAAAAVVAAHIWPRQLRFRGGKGLATSFGALLAMGYQLIVGPILLLIPTYAFVRQVTMTGLVAFASTPLVALWWRGWGVEVAASAVVVALLLFAHREAMTDYFRGRRRRVATSRAGES